MKFIDRWEDDVKVLILAGVAPSTVFSHVPLANALRNAGHQVMMSVSIDEMIPTITEVGLAAVPVADPNKTPREIIADGGLAFVPEKPLDRERMSGRWYAHMEYVTMDNLLAFAKDWRPDVVIGGESCYSAPLLAQHLDIPYVRHGWDIHDARLMDEGAEEQLHDQLAELGLDGLPEPDMTIDITPPSLRPPGVAPAQMMRWIPGNAQRRLEPWMYTKGAPVRIGVTLGTGVASYNQFDYLQGVVENVASLDAEVVVAVAEDAASTMRERLGDNVHLGWIPLDVVAPTCDVIVHQTGGSTMMTALSYGVPQVLIPDTNMFRTAEMARRLAEAGAAVVLTQEEATSEVITKVCQEIITNPSYTEAAAGLAAEIAALPLPDEVARRVEWLVNKSA